MALITDLPAASSLATTDLLIKDTGSATQKIAISDAYATASQPGFVSTGAQTIAGIKTFTSYPYIAQTTANSDAINYVFTDKNNDIYAQGIVGYSQNNGGRFNFREWADDANGNRSNYREDFRLPAPTGGRTANATYEIITTKNLTDAGIYKTSFSTAKSITIPNSYRGVMYVIDTTNANCGEYILYSNTSGGVTAYALHTASGITITTSTNTLTITPSAGTKTILILSASNLMV